LSTQNVPLLTFIAENLFRTDNFEKAGKILEKAFQFAPQNEKVLLLLGAILADSGETERARKLLSVPARNPKSAVCVNFIWGMLAAFEENWSESAAAFKEAAGTEESAELQYLAGCVYFQVRQFENSLSHFQKAASLDEKFADAQFMQSVVYKLKDDAQRAESARETALESKETGAQCLEYLKGKKSPDFETALPFLHFKQSKKLLTGGSVRLTKFFRRQIFKSIE
jgi:tetratricopeptide (TPR) repeat protein